MSRLLLGALGVGLAVSGCAPGTARQATTLPLKQPTVQSDGTSGSATTITYTADSRNGAVLPTRTRDRLIAVTPGVLQVDQNGQLVNAWRSIETVTVTVVRGQLRATLRAGTPRPVTVTLRPEHDLLRSVRWTTIRDRPRLAVQPSPFAREAGEAATDPLWQQVLRLSPAADQPGLADQLRCHLALSPLKREYHLEPWRPAVGYPETLAKLCNPGPDGFLG